MKRNNLYWLVAILLLTFTGACKKDTDGTMGTQTSHVTVKMIDGPGDYEAVWIDVKDVMVSSSDSDGGWVSLAGIRPGIYNLLELTNGIDTVLADGLVPSGRINQIRLVLGTNNSVVIDGQTYVLETPSAQQSGLKLNFHTELVANASYVFTLDFDAGKSIVLTGGGKYQLKPVIKVFVESEKGSISGELNPSMVAYVTTSVNLEENDDDDVSTYSDISGKFLLQGLESGTYDVRIISPAGSGFGEKVIENVIVVEGQVTSLGVVDL